MIYVATISGPTVKAAIAAGHLAGMATPQGNSIIPTGAWWAADNGRFGKGWPGTDAWWRWLTKTVNRYGPDLCMFATAPDVVGDAQATLLESEPWLPRIRAIGVPAAFVAQNGCADDLIPWGSFDVLFLGGDDVFKLGPEARAVTADALARGVPVHMGRVNSRRRLRYAEAIGCASADGTYIAFGPDLLLPDVLRWVRELDEAIPLFAADGASE